ncbi:MAG: DinB family protein [Pyrinomonadaceae bacterium]
MQKITAGGLLALYRNGFAAGCEAWLCRAECAPLNLVGAPPRQRLAGVARRLMRAYGAAKPRLTSGGKAECARLSDIMNPSIPGAMMNRMTPEDFREVIRSLEQTPLVVARVFNPLSQADLKVKNSDDFSVLENICHLRDIEIEGYRERIVRILEEDNPSLADVDGARLAIERNYNDQDGKAALKAFCDARDKNIDLLKDLSPEQLTRAGTLEGVGPISLEKLMHMMVEHDQGHVAELMTISRRTQRSETTGF